jgi:hypothetical protein
MEREKYRKYKRSIEDHVKGSRHPTCQLSAVAGRLSRGPGATTCDTKSESIVDTLLFVITCEHLSMANQANLPPSLSNV